METKFIPTLQAGNGYTYLKLKGILDEDNLLSNLLSQIQGRLLLIDMAEIERINSCGVRDWVNWNNQIQALGIGVILLRCSPVVVSQANMVTNFAADAFIHSFYAPYVHPDTGEEQSVLLFTEEIRKSNPVSAPKIYNENGEELEFDEFEESYFAFIGDPRIRNYQVSPEVQAVIQYYMPEAATRQPVVGQKPSGASSVSAPVPSSPQGYGMPGGYGGAGGGMNARGGGMTSGMQGSLGGIKAGPGAGLAAGPGFGGALGGAGPRPMGANFPMSAAAPPLRHEQPPLPSSGMDQQAPSPAQRPAGQPLPSQSAAPGAQNMPNPGAMSGSAPVAAPARPAEPAPAPAPEPEASPAAVSSEPRPAPQPVSPLAAQSMARQQAALGEDPAKPKIATNAKNAAPATVMNYKMPLGGSGGSGKLLQDRKFQIVLAVGLIVIIALIIALIIVAKSKS